MEERKKLTAEKIKILFEFGDNGKFDLNTSITNLEACECFGIVLFGVIRKIIDKINQRVTNRQEFYISKREVVQSPSKKVWLWTHISLVLIFLSFLLEILSVYYIDEISLLLFGLVIMLIGLGIQLVVMLKQMFVHHKAYDSNLQEESTVLALQSIIDSEILLSNDILVKNSLTFICDSPFKIAFQSSPGPSAK